MKKRNKGEKRNESCKQLSHTKVNGTTKTNKIIRLKTLKEKNR